MKLFIPYIKIEEKNKVIFFLPPVHQLMDLFELKFYRFSHLYKPQLMQVLNIHLLELLIHHKHQHKHVFFPYIKDLVVFQQLHPKINFYKKTKYFRKIKSLQMVIMIKHIQLILA